MSESTWRCAECDTFNQQGAADCSVCGSAKPRPRASGKGWTCPGCGASNRPRAYACSRCERVIPLDDLLTILDGAPPPPPRPTAPPRRPSASEPHFRVIRTTTVPPSSPPPPPPRPARAPRTGLDWALGFVGLVVLLAVVGVVAIGVLAVAGFLDSEGNAESIGTPEPAPEPSQAPPSADPCPAGIAGALAGVEGTRTAATYTSRDYEVTFCETAGGADFLCAVERRGGQDPYVYRARWEASIWPHTCGTVETARISAVVTARTMTIYEYGVRTTEQDLDDPAPRA